MNKPLAIATQFALTGAIGLCAVTLATPVRGQTLSVTGGFANFDNTEIFVPLLGVGSEVWQGSTPTSYLIRTSQGDIPLNAVFRTEVLPQLSTQFGQTPTVGDTGSVFGTLTFRGFGADGQRAFFNNLPTTLQFQVNQISLDPGRSFTRYNTNPFSLTTTGTASGAGGSGSVQQTQTVVRVQYQPFPLSPIDDGVVSAEAFVNSVLGVSYSADFNTTLTGGSVAVPEPPGFSPTSSISLSPISTGIFSEGNLGNSQPISTATTIDSPFNGRPPRPRGSIGRSRRTPIFPGRVFRGVFVFVGVWSGYWYDPPMADSFEYEMVPSSNPVGLAGRVFPGMTGTQMSDNSLFTAISGLPSGIDADDRFTVSVEGVTLGEFSADETVNFADYQEQLGDLLVKGEGVKKFTISGIDPSVDADNPLAFPVKLDFNTPTASFEMRAGGEGIDENASVSILSEEMMQTRLQNQQDLAARRESIIAEVMGETPLISEAEESLMELSEGIAPLPIPDILPEGF